MFESGEGLLDLAKVAEEELERATDQRRIVVHDELDEDAQERLAAGAVQVQVGELVLVLEEALGLVHHLHERHLLVAPRRRRLGHRVAALLVHALEYGQQVGEPIVEAHIQDELVCLLVRIKVNNVSLMYYSFQHICLLQIHTHTHTQTRDTI